MEGGIEAWSCGNSAITRSTVSMMFAPGWRKITTVTAGFPLASRECGRPRRVLHVRHIPQADRSPFVVGNDEGAVLIGAKDLVVVADRPGVGSVRQLSLGWFALAAFRAVRTCSVPIPSLLRRVGFTSARTAGLAPPRCIPARHPAPERSFEPGWSRPSRRCGAGDRIGGQRQNQNGLVGGIDLVVVRILRQVGRKLAAGGVDRGLHVACRRIDVAVQIELYNDIRRTEQADRSHLVDAGNSPELALQRGGNGGSHRLGAGAGQASRDLNHRVVNLRQRRNRKEVEGERFPPSPPPRPAGRCRPAV